MSAPTAEAFAPQQEQKVGSERLTHGQMRRELAKLAVFALLIAQYSSHESDSLFVQPKEAEDDTQAEENTPATSGGEILGLLDNALKNERHADSLAATAGIDAYRRDFYAHRTSDLPARQEPKPFFETAPAMAAAPLGPELPNLAFNDRIRPQNAQPTDAQFAAAGRANEMYQRELLKQGWNGGEATAEQAKKAGRGLRREYSPDLPGTSAADIDAVKSFNSQHAKPTTPGQADAGNAAS